MSLLAYNLSNVRDNKLHKQEGSLSLHERVQQHLMSEVVHSQDGASLAVDPMRSVLGRQVDRHQGSMPVISNEDTVISKEASVQFQDERGLQGSHIQQGKAELQQSHRGFFLAPATLPGRCFLLNKNQSGPEVSAFKLHLQHHRLKLGKAPHTCKTIDAQASASVSCLLIFELTEL